MHTTINKSVLESYGFKPAVARRIIREAKQEMVNKGFNFYDNSKLGIVPIEAVEEIIGFKLEKKLEVV
ncbi:DUF3173 family protein [Carnobacterium maltaromaticum]|uniref:DUF3173 family protein n=1 Tax=Carnobacterium maltaromaticum TaxID=2751 RepID=UPI0039B0BC9A